MEHKTIDRFRGCIYGQAIGDALGLGTEFMTDETIAWKYPHGLQHNKQIYQDKHRKRWEIGDWTDDTDMMLCIAEILANHLTQPLLIQSFCFCIRRQLVSGLGNAKRNAVMRDLTFYQSTFE